MTYPLISIIVPCYNVEQYLTKCIDSIIAQTYHNLEIILVDDGSPDTCGKICDFYAIKDSRIKVIHKINGGQADARNQALEVMKGEYVTFVDSDDFVAKDYVEILYKLIMKHQCDMSIALYESFHVGQTPKCQSNNLQEEIFSSDEAVENLFYQVKFDTTVWGKLYKSSLFTPDIRFPKGIIYEDLATLYRVIQNAKRVAYSNIKPYYYLIRSDSSEGEPFKPQKFESCMRVIRQLEKDKSFMLANVQKALDCRIVSLAFHLLLEIPNTHYDMRKTLNNIIKDKRRNVLLNNNARKKTRVACFLSYLGMWLINLLSEWGKSR